MVRSNQGKAMARGSITYRFGGGPSHVARVVLASSSSKNLSASDWLSVCPTKYVLRDETENTIEVGRRGRLGSVTFLRTTPFEVRRISVANPMAAPLSASQPDAAILVKNSILTR
jgi:hypothetical protein